MWKPAFCALLIAPVAGPLAAQEALPDFEWDGSFSYAARATLEDSDNDIIRATIGATWRVEGGQWRGAAELGVRNEDFSSSYPANLGAEISRSWGTGWGRHSVGGRIRWADDRETSGELAYSAERFGNAIDLRGMLGVQYVTGAEDLTERTETSAFGQIEAIWFPLDDLALWAGLMGDADGDIGGIGVEYRPRRWPVSFFMEWGHTLVEYRGLEGYNDLYGGIRFVPRSRSLKQHRRAVTDRSFARYVEVQ
ncbi:MAG: hypothetical protein OIF40_05685 [Mangrovicoccus sp.]|nr:hypothetical protein [Mangrovicoccus sp.]